MQLLFIFMLSVTVLIAQGQVISIRHTVFNLYFGSKEDPKNIAPTVPGSAEILAEIAMVADATNLLEDTNLNEVNRYANVKKCVMSYCVAYCRKMGYHSGACVPPDTCDCYN